MKYIILTFAMTFCAILQAQSIYIDDYDINAPENEVFLIEVGIFAGAVWIYYPGMDKEQRRNKNRFKQAIRDDSGLMPEVISDLDVFNWLEKNGWEYFIQLPADIPASTRYLFRRKI